MVIFLCPWKGSGSVVANPRYGCRLKLREEVQSNGWSECMLHTWPLISKPASRTSHPVLNPKPHAFKMQLERTAAVRNLKDVTQQHLALTKPKPGYGELGCAERSDLYCMLSALFTVTCASSTTYVQPARSLPLERVWGPPAMPLDRNDT